MTTPSKTLRLPKTTGKKSQRDEKTASVKPWARRKKTPAVKIQTAEEKRASLPVLSPTPLRGTQAISPAPKRVAEQSGVRVSKLLAERGICSRREADEYIERGWVSVDGQVIALGARAPLDAKIALAPQAQKKQERRVTILLHKPVGYVSSQPEDQYPAAVELIKPDNLFAAKGDPAFSALHLRGLAPAGRLDIDSTGLLVLTQDGTVARHLVGNDSSVEKEYLVRFEGMLDDDGLALLKHGLSLDDKPLKPALVERLNNDQLRFVLKEGKKRQIRRMCDAVGLRVVGLKRVRIGNVRLGNLPLGQWRYLAAHEYF